MNSFNIWLILLEECTRLKFVENLQVEEPDIKTGMWKNDEPFTVMNILCVHAYCKALISSEVISFIWCFGKPYSPQKSWAISSWTASLYFSLIFC